MGKKKHKEGKRVGKFCALKANKCEPPCTSAPPNKYRENCEPPPAGWDKLTYPQQFRKFFSRRRPWEAHHVLCVSAVNSVFTGRSSGITKIVKQTEWCINNKNNMYAMPMWGHTLRWYINAAEPGFRMIKLADGSVWHKSSIPPPPFENIPQHNYGHGDYIEEVKTKLKRIAAKVKEGKESHEIKVQNLRDDIDDASIYFKEKLDERGQRCGGTHKAWDMGLRASGDSKSDWYKPFSMAASPREITFPCTAPSKMFSGEMGRRIGKHVQFMWTNIG
jgi:hypothetical protein